MYVPSSFELFLSVTGNDPSRGAFNRLPLAERVNSPSGSI